MTSLRRLNNGKWNKSPTLYAARRIIFEALQKTCKTVRLGEAASFVNGTSYDSSLLKEIGTPIIRISNISDPLSDSLKTIETFDPKFYVEKGDLLVSWSASFKSILWPGEFGVLNQHIFKVMEREEFSRDYLRHAIEYVFDDLQQKVVGIGMMHLRRQDFLGHQIPAPDIEMQIAVSRYLTWIEDEVGDEPFLPLPEQRRIVARVKGMLAKVEEARELKSATSELLGYWQSQGKRTLFEPLFASNEASELGSISDVRAGVTLGRVVSGGVKVPYLRVANVQDGFLDLGVIKEIEVYETEIEKWKLVKDDLLLTEGGDWDKLGRGTLWNDEIETCIHQNHVFRVRIVDDEFIPSFVAACLASPQGKEYFQSSSKQTTNLASINQKQLKAFKVPRISVAEQESILASIAHLSESEKSIRQLQAQTQRELDALPASILARAFAGGAVTGSAAGPNRVKQERYARAHERLTLALEHGFYIEAAMICESIITDRLHSHLHWRVTVAGTLSPNVVKENGLRGKLDFEGHGNLGLLIRILELDFDHLGKERFHSLPAHLEEWREARNKVAHGMTHTSPAKKDYADNFEAFLQRAEQCARQGKPLVNCLTDWDRAVRRRHHREGHAG